MSPRTLPPALVAAAAAALAIGCGPSAAGCADHRQARLPSPDGRHDAVLFERGCGATSDIGTYVAVLPAGDSLPADEWPPMAFGYGHQAMVAIRWQSPDTLVVIRRPEIARAGREWPEAGGVHVLHRDDPTMRGQPGYQGGLTLR